MFKRVIVMNALLMLAAILVCIPAYAEYVVIDTAGTSPFMYENRSYVPLKKVAGFLGASLMWDSAKSQAVVNYKGQNLALTSNNTNAVYRGQSVALSSPPVVINGRMYVPVDTFKNYYNTPVEWDRERSEMRIMGPSGWGTVKVQNRPPWHGGPPPWAPAWGHRGHKGSDNQGQYKGESKQKGKGQNKNK